MRGNIDLMSGIAIFFAIILIGWIMTLIGGGIFNALSSSNSVHNYAPANAIITKGNGFLTGFNTVVAFAFIFICIGAIVAAAFTESNPFFAAIGLILLPIELVFSFGMHDAFFQMIQNSAFTGLVAAYPFVVTTFQYLPLISLVVAMILAIVSFSR